MAAAGVWPERTVLGPWGEGLGHGNTPFDYRPEGTIVGLKIRYDSSYIRSLTFMSRKGDGGVVLSPEFGFNESSYLTHEIFFTVDEYIIGIDLLLSSPTGHLKWLRVYTNKKIYRVDADNDVTTPRTSILIGGVVVGFFGSTYSSSKLFYGIGIYTVPYDKVTSYGIAPDNKTVNSWTYLPQGLTTKIVITHAEVINSLAFESKTNEGLVTASGIFGGTNGCKTEVNISPCEFITEIDMMVGEYDGQSVITFLSIHTNVKTYGPFGKARGSKIKIPINVGSVVGFFGRAGMYLNSLDIFEVVIPNTKNYGDKTVKSWTYLPQGSTTKVVIGHAEVINSIVFESKTDAGLVTASERFGGTDGHKTEVLLSLGEFITEINMMVREYDGESVVSFLSIHTNVKTYGPFGNDKGSKIKVTINEGSVVGFFGRAGMYLNSFDIFEVVRPKSSDYEDKASNVVQCMSIGPFGGPEDEGQLWTYKPQDGLISEIVIRYGSVIDSIVLQGKTTNGSVAYSRRFGGNGGNRTKKLSFGPGEYITGIEVVLGNFQGQTVVYNLSICTNVTSYGPFGTTSGTQLSIPIRDGRVVGFFGRSGTYLNAIGAYTVANALKTGPFLENKGPLGGKTWDECILFGPWGGLEGKFWAYRPTEFITKIEIQYGDCIDSLTFHMTARDGSVTKSKRFGGDGGDETEEVIIDSGEYITGVDMMVGEHDGQSVITLLSFLTNITTYGPFGSGSGSKISIPIKDGSVVGFYGRYGRFLNSIGIFTVVK